MKELAGVLVALVAVISYVVAATQLGLYQRYPVVHLLAGAAAVVFLAFVTAARKGRRRIYAGACLTVALALLGLFAWWTLSDSAYASTDAAVEVGDELGDRLAALRLPSHTGAEAPLLRLGEDRGTLLVFYRGFW